MKHLLLSILTMAVFAATFLPFRVNGEVQSAISVPQESYFEEKLEPIYMPPVKIIVPGLEISKNLVKLSVDSAGVMETPEDYMDIGYFIRSVKVGEIGNVVIAAHYDNSSGGPAAFWELKNLILNDKVILIDKYGRQFVYQVTESFLVDIEDPNRLQVIDKESSKSELTLLTCGGVWDSVSGTYTKRLVVKAELL